MRQIMHWYRLSMIYRILSLASIAFGMCLCTLSFFLQSGVHVYLYISCLHLSILSPLHMRNLKGPENDNIS